MRRPASTADVRPAAGYRAAWDVAPPCMRASLWPALAAAQRVRPQPDSPGPTVRGRRTWRWYLAHESAGGSSAIAGDDHECDERQLRVGACGSPVRARTHDHT